VSPPTNLQRGMGLFDATALGVGAIVGGGFLVLAGVAFSAAGPAAIIAFALNGMIAMITVASFAKLVRRFPESGGIYTYARKVVPIEQAFVIGWQVWFASIVAGVLYALGFGVFAGQGAARLLGESHWLASHVVQVSLALAVIIYYALSLTRKATGGGNAPTVGKVAVLLFLMAFAAVAFVAGDSGELVSRMSPFSPAGATGLLAAMGLTFIALQGFDLIAAVGGEVREPERLLPKSMYLSLGTALVIYLPLLFLLATVGAPEDGITAVARENPEGLVAEAAERIMGPVGYWVVLAAGILSMLSALYANLLAASRVALAMAGDHTLPRVVGRISKKSGTPVVAVVATGVGMLVLVAVVGEVESAAAASSLIFLVSFAAVHLVTLLLHRRSGGRGVPVLPSAGAALCLALALFQAFAVPLAGIVIVVWLLVGIGFYLAQVGRGAGLADVSALATDPELARLRGMRPLVLIPIANPETVQGLIDVGATLQAPGSGRVMLMSVVQAPPAVTETGDSARARELSGREVPGELSGTVKEIAEASDLLQKALWSSVVTDIQPETLFTFAPSVWDEIVDAANTHRCETVLLGLARIADSRVTLRLEDLLRRIDANVVILRAGPGWRVDNARKIIIPVSETARHSRLRTLLLASLGRRHIKAQITYLGVLPKDASPQTRARVERLLATLARDEAHGFEVDFDCTEDVAADLKRRQDQADLVVLRLPRRADPRSAIGQLTLDVARETDVPLLLFSDRARFGLRPGTAREGLAARETSPSPPTR